MTAQATPRIFAPRAIAFPSLLLRIAAYGPLLAILGLQGALSLSLRNTAFQDEALYLYAGRQVFNSLLGGAPPSESYALYFSGSPYLYPVLAGALDEWGGLEAARLLSLACMLFCTVAVSLLARWLYSKDAALPAAAVFAVQGSVLFLGRLATYDAMCLALLALAAVLVVRAGGNGQLWLIPLAGLALSLAIATKYVGLLFAPIVAALLIWQTMRLHGWRRALGHTALLVATMLILIAIVLLRSGQDILVGVSGTTTARVALLTAPRMELLLRSVTLGGGLLALALGGWAISTRQHLVLGLGLIGTALLAPAYHIYKAEAVSLPKHIAFGLFFIAPLAGHLIAQVRGDARARLAGARWLAALAICVLLFGHGFTQARALYAEWADSDAMVRLLRTQVRPGSGRILAEESEVARYYLQDIVAPWQWNNLYWFEYTTPAGAQLAGEPAYKAAIADGYFDLVIFRYGPSAATAYAIDGGLRDGTHYDSLARIPYYTNFGAGEYWIWHRNGR